MVTNRQFSPPPFLSQWVVVATAAIVVFVLFTSVSMLIHGNFGTSAYDLGEHDQAFWRYSRLLDTFNTIRGMSALGDHFWVNGFIFAPLYALYPSVGWPLAAQALSVAAGGMVLFLITRIRLPASPWLGAGLVLSYFLHPAVHSTLIWQYHEIVLASGLYMGLIWSYLCERKALFIIMILLLLTCREDMPFTIFAFGVLAGIDKRYDCALWAFGLAIAWWIFAIKFAMPYFNGQGYFRHEHGPLTRIFANIANPKFYIDRFLDPQSLRYLWQVFFPVGFLALLSPKYLLPALPTLVANILIGTYMNQIGFHYSVSIMPFLFWGGVESMRAPSVIAKVLTEKTEPWLATGLVALTLAAYSQYSSLNLRYFPAQVRDWQAKSPKRDFIEQLDKKIGTKGVAASGSLLPHLSHREKIYLFPNPWKVYYWGINGENPHHPNQVDYIVIDKGAVSDHMDLINYLTSTGLFRKIEEKQSVIVLERVRPEASDRTLAIADFEEYVDSPANGLEFTELALSPKFATQEADFRRLDVDPVLLQDTRPKSWMSDKLPKQTRLLDIKFSELGNDNEWKSRYLRAVVKLTAPKKARLELGSDDGVTVWVNGVLIHEKIMARAARLGEDKFSLHLNAGRNVFLFRVNNISDPWRLLVKLRALSDDQ